MESWFETSRSEQQAAIHEELNRLPRVYRTVIILCALEGRPIEQAARELRWPVRSVERRLSRALEHLRLRLLRRFYEIPVRLWDTDILQDLGAVVPESLVESTIAAATCGLDPSTGSRSDVRNRNLPGASLSH